MKLEQQVCSLDLARKLNELGVKQESLYFWYWTKDESALYGRETERERLEPDTASAFTCGELGEMLPKWIPKKGNYDYCNYVTRNDQWEVEYSPLDTINGEHLHTEVANTEADARAKMLCYLLEQGIINSNIYEQSTKEGIY